MTLEVCGEGGEFGADPVSPRHMARFVGLRTRRLYFRPFTPAELLALREGDEAFAAESRLIPEPGLRPLLVSDYVSPKWLDHLRASVDSNPWEFGYAVVEPLTGTVVGMAAFKGTPDRDGVVEIAYGIVPSRRGMGYATEAAGALIEYASKDERVRRIRAHTLPATNESTSVLTKCGFTRVADVDDPEDGPVWRWERDPIPDLL